MSITGNTDCIGDYFLYNQQAYPVNDFQQDFLTSGKSLYEVIRIIQRKPLFLEEHLDRLQRSAELSQLDILPPKNAIVQSMKTLCDINSLVNGNMKLVFRTLNGNNDYIFFYDCHKYPQAEEYAKGVPVGIHYAERPDPNVKLVNMALRKASRQHMQEGGYYEVILVNRNEDITEGSRSNIFFISGKEVFTPPLSEVLPGITRQKIIDICEKRHIPLHEQTIPLSSISSFESAFITATSPKVLPLRSIGNTIFSVNNPITNTISQDYNKLIEMDLQDFHAWD
ncbi:MAG: aminotransferase class IV [Bacteroidetes bacterium]|nr:aminotransferase class IV [Bacteroidota bacterium]